jgi:hypothetical protein
LPQLALVQARATSGMALIRVFLFDRAVGMSESGSCEEDEVLACTKTPSCHTRSAGAAPRPRLDKPSSLSSRCSVKHAFSYAKIYIVQEVARQ